MPPSPDPIDEGPATQADLDPEMNRGIGNFREKLGLPRGPGFLDDSLAPPVDEELVRAYVDRRLGGEQSAEVFERSTKFRSWNEQVHKLLLARARAEVAGESPGES